MIDNIYLLESFDLCYIFIQVIMNLKIIQLVYYLYLLYIFIFTFIFISIFISISIYIYFVIRFVY